MKIIEFIKKDKGDEEVVDTSLSHISVQIDGNSYVIREERGLEETVGVIDGKDELLDYLRRIL